jgi:hypothetical protein
LISLAVCQIVHGGSSVAAAGRIARLERFTIMKPEMLAVILFALAVAAAITAWISAGRFIRRVPGERRRVSGVIWGSVMAAVFAFAGIWTWLEFS